MTTIRIELPDQQANVLSAQAAAHGLTLEDWIQNLAVETPAKDASPID